MRVCSCFSSVNNCLNCPPLPLLVIAPPPTLPRLPQVTGVYQSLAHIFKLLPRGSLLRHVPALYAVVAENAAADQNRANVMFRKLSVKLLQRIALTFLAPRDTAWRYQMGACGRDMRLGSVSSFSCISFFRFASCFLVFCQ